MLNSHQKDLKRTLYHFLINSMITRVVKLEFQQEQIETFLSHFEQVKWSVATFPGCRGMKLIQDIKNPCVVMTYSIWENETALNQYRDSELFKSVWSYTKTLFAEKPVAFSSKKIQELS